MTPGLDDPEDSPPMAPPPTLPDNERPFPPHAAVPDSLLPKPSTATTEPAPDDTAAAILKLLEPSFNNLHTKLDELLRLRESDSARLQAVDGGVGSALTQVGLLEDAVLKNGATIERLANAILAVSSSVNDLREGLSSQSTHDKARLAKAELAGDELAQRIEWLEQAAQK